MKSNKLKSNIFVLFIVISLALSIVIPLTFAFSPLGDFYVSDKLITSDGFVIVVERKGKHFLFGEFTNTCDTLIVDESFYNLFDVGDSVDYDRFHERILLDGE